MLSNFEVHRIICDQFDHHYLIHLYITTVKVNFVLYLYISNNFILSNTSTLVITVYIKSDQNELE